MKLLPTNVKKKKKRKKGSYNIVNHISARMDPPKHCKERASGSQLNPVLGAG